MICPIMYMKNTVNFNCMGSQCAWFDEDTGNCAMYLMSKRDVEHI